MGEKAQVRVKPIGLKVVIFAKGEKSPLLDIDVPIDAAKLGHLVKILERRKAWFASGADLGSEAVRANRELFDDFEVNGAAVEFRVFRDG